MFTPTWLVLGGGANHSCLYLSLLWETWNTQSITDHLGALSSIKCHIHQANGGGTAHGLFIDQSIKMLLYTYPTCVSCVGVWLMWQTMLFTPPPSPLAIQNHIGIHIVDSDTSFIQCSASMLGYAYSSGS